MKDKDKLKSIWKSARKRWRNKKSVEKGIKNHVDAAKPPTRRKTAQKQLISQQNRRAIEMWHMPLPWRKFVQQKLLHILKILGYWDIWLLLFGELLRIHGCCQRIIFKISKKMPLDMAEMISNLGNHHCAWKAKENWNLVIIDYGKCGLYRIKNHWCLCLLPNSASTKRSIPISLQK